MPITVEEQFKSRFVTTGQNASVELRYVVMGTDDDAAAQSAVETEAPSSYSNLPRRSVRVEPLATMLWDATAIYGSQTRADAPETGESVYAFETSGGREHITQSITTRWLELPPDVLDRMIAARR